MKKMNKVIAAMMMMAITTAMPAMANNQKHPGNDRKDDVFMMVNGHKGPHHFKADRKAPHYNAHKKNIHRPNVKSCSFRVSRYSSPRHVVNRIERMHGVIDTHWNPYTHEVTVVYDARVTSAHHIMHSVA